MPKNPIPCGGFDYDENTLRFAKRDGRNVLEVIGGTQPDWNQNDATAADYIKNRPFYQESPILYDGYPEYEWGYAKLPFVLREGVSYSVTYNVPGEDWSYGFFRGEAEPDSDGDLEIEYIDSLAGTSFRLDYNAGDNYTTFFPDGALWQEGCPESSEDGSYAYTSKYKLKFEFTDPDDAGVVTLDPKYLPEGIGGLPVYTSDDLTDDVKFELAKNMTPHVIRNVRLPDIECGDVTGSVSNTYVYRYELSTEEHEDIYNCGDMIPAGIVAESSSREAWSIELTDEQIQEIITAWGG